MFLSVSGDISASKHQGQKPTLNGHDLWSLHQKSFCYHITTWAQEHFRKPSSVKTVNCYIYKLELYNAKQQLYINIQDGLSQSGKMSVVLWDHILNYFGKSWMSCPPGQIAKGPFGLLSEQSSKASTCDVWGSVCTHSMGNLHLWRQH